jgi:hypothetical protein
MVQREASDCPVGSLPLADQGRELGFGLVGVDVVEGGVGSIGAPIQTLDRFTAETATKPGALNVGDVPDQAE